MSVNVHKTASKKGYKQGQIAHMFRNLVNVLKCGFCHGWQQIAHVAEGRSTCSSVRKEHLLLKTAVQIAIAASLLLAVAVFFPVSPRKVSLRYGHRFTSHEVGQHLTVINELKSG